MTAIADLVGRQREQAAREAALLAAVEADPVGRWKSGRAVRALRAAGFHPISPNTAASLLTALAMAGHLVRHHEPGRTWYETTGGR